MLFDSGPTTGRREPNLLILVQILLILVSKSRWRVEEGEVAFIAMMKVPFGNAFLHSSLPKQGLVGKLRQEKPAVGASQRSLHFVAPWACRSCPRHQNDWNAVANDI
jgi:hypothetical protein